MVMVVENRTRFFAGGNENIVFNLLLLHQQGNAVDFGTMSSSITNGHQVLSDSTRALFTWRSMLPCYLHGIILNMLLWHHQVMVLILVI